LKGVNHEGPEVKAGRGALARLEVLEVRERERVAGVEAVKEGQDRQALERLSAADRAAVFENLKALDAGGAWWAAVCAAVQAAHGEPLPGGDAARAWEKALYELPDGLPYPAPPAGSARYFEAEAARCDAMKEEARTRCEDLPDGVTGDALEAGARWSAAWWRYLVAMASVTTQTAGGEA
jgi:hypothetical protein